MDKRIIFVHGLGGNAETWGKMPEFINADPSIVATCDHWVYPTARLGLKFFKYFQKNYLGVHELANSLKTFIDTKHGDADEIVLVGHSLGGLVIKQYLLNLNASRELVKIKQVVLYAVPNNGAETANVISLFSLWKNPQLINLKIGSTYLEDLIRNWHVSDIEEIVSFSVVIGGNDRIVNAASAKGTFKYLNLKTIPSLGHIDICKPRTTEDLSYLILKNVLLKKKYLHRFTQLGAEPFSEWLKYTQERKFDFQLDDARQAVFNSLTAELETTKSTLRVKGLSGLGKSRLVFEVIKAADTSIQEKVAYLKASTQSINLPSALKDAIKQDYEGILIVDNCKPDLHAELAREVMKDSSRVLLISLDYSLDNLSSTHGKEWVIGRMEDRKIKAMLEPEFGDKIPDLERIAKFAQGFPKMAFLISQARLANETDLGKLNDDDLANKLLGPISIEQENILRACSLFDLFGSEAELANDYKYIADNIAKVKHESFYACLKQFQEKGLIDKSGRYSQLVPKPLAVRLASKWWTQTSPESQQAVIDSIPQALIEQFCKQVTMLGFLPEVKGLTTKLCGVSGPFGQAEVILSERGSLLFRSFVEVNPESTAKAIHTVLNNLPLNELNSISGDVRRNLVWALEKLAFHSEVFHESAWCLALLATAENETWSNNATGMFSQLFDVHVSGTEANYPARITLINDVLALDSTEADAIVIEAMKQAISIYSGGRTVGAEYQANQPPLVEYRPRIWQEIFDYWQASINILLGLVEKRNVNSGDAANVIGYSIRSLLGSGRVELLDKAIKKVVEIRGPYWPSALENLKSALEFDASSLPAEANEALSKWLVMLNPPSATIEDKLRIIVVNPPWEHRKNGEGHYIDVAAENAKTLAKELSSVINLNDEQIEILFEGDFGQAFSFGKAWIESIEDGTELIDRVIEKVKAIEKANLNFLLGLMEGIYSRSNQVWSKYIFRFANETDLQRIYPFVIHTGLLESNHIHTLLELIKHNILSPNAALSLGHGGRMEHFSSKEVSEFCSTLASVNEPSAWAALDVMFMYCFGSEQKFKENELVLQQLVLSVSLDKKVKTKTTDMYHWKEVIDKFLISSNFGFAKSVCLQILSTLDERTNFDYLHNYIKPVLVRVIELFGDRLWPIFGEIILAHKSHYGRLTIFFGKEDSISFKSLSPLNLFDSNDLISWAKTDLDFAPYFLARSISIFEIKSSDENGVTDLAIKLLENFGQLPNLGSELSANISTRGWSGSLVPYLESDKNALMSLLEHSNRYVREWAKSHIDYCLNAIEYESIRDAELLARFQ